MRNQSVSFAGLDSCARKAWATLLPAVEKTSMEQCVKAGEVELAHAVIHHRRPSLLQDSTGTRFDHCALQGALETRRVWSGNNLSRERIVFVYGTVHRSLKSPRTECRQLHREFDGRERLGFDGELERKPHQNERAS